MKKSLFEEHGSEAVGVLQGSMTAEAEKIAIPSRFITECKGNQIEIMDITTCKLVKVPLFAYGAVRRALNNLFG